MGADVKENTRDICGDGTILYLICDDGCVVLYVC